MFWSILWNTSQIVFVTSILFVIKTLLRIDHCWFIHVYIYSFESVSKTQQLLCKIIYGWIWQLFKMSGDIFSQQGRMSQMWLIDFHGITEGEPLQRRLHDSCAARIVVLIISLLFKFDPPSVKFDFVWIYPIKVCFT